MDLHNTLSKNIDIQTAFRTNIIDQQLNLLNPTSIPNYDTLIKKFNDLVIMKNKVHENLLYLKLINTLENELPHNQIMSTTATLPVLLPIYQTIQRQQQKFGLNDLLTVSPSFIQEDLSKKIQNSSSIIFPYKQKENEKTAGPLNLSPKSSSLSHQTFSPKLNTPSTPNSETKSKKINSCGHTDRKHYAKVIPFFPSILILNQ